MTHPLSLAFLTLHDVPPAEVARAAAATGYDLIGLRLLPAAPGEAAYPLMTDPAARRAVRAVLADTGLGVGDVEIVRLKPDTRAAAFLPFLECAAELGARHVLVAGDDPDAARLTAGFAAFCELARGFALTADLEFMPWTAVPDLRSALAVVEGAGQDNGGVLVDALHYDRSATTLDEIRALPRRRVNYVQVCDGPADYDPSTEGLIRVARSARLFPGEGGIDLRGLVRAVPDDATISVEVPNHALAATATPTDRARRAMASTLALLEQAGRQPSRRAVGTP